MGTSLHNQLIASSEILNTSISSFAKSLTKPNGHVGISHTAIILAAKGESNTQWIIDEITKFINKAKKENPEYFTVRTEFLEKNGGR